MAKKLGSALKSPIVIVSGLGLIAYATISGRESNNPERMSLTSESSRAYYRNCDAARAAGVAPLYRGDPGYRPKLDRDRDGIACEPYPR